MEYFRCVLRRHLIKKFKDVGAHKGGLFTGYSVLSLPAIIHKQHLLLGIPISLQTRFHAMIKLTVSLYLILIMTLCSFPG